MMAAARAKDEIEPLSTTEDDGKMKFILNSHSYSYDISGYKDDETINSSFSGYQVSLRLNGREYNCNFNSDMEYTRDDLNVYLRAAIEQLDGISYVRLSYYVENTNESEAVTFSLGSHADTRVGGDDSAAVKRTDDGILMLGRDAQSQGEYCNAFVCKDSEDSAASVDRWWYGPYGERYRNIFSGDLPTEDLENVDSGMAYAWLDQTIDSGETVKYSVLFGIGDIGDYSEEEQPDSSNGNTSSDSSDDHDGHDDNESHDDTRYWENEDGKWTFNNGTSYRDQWGYVYYNGSYNWYFFDQDGYMATGWHTDQDGRKYYLNPSSDGRQGAMSTGWNLIEGKWYYFSQESGAGLGQLLVSTTTPDGYAVNEDGVWE